MFCVVQDIYRHAPNLLYADVIFPAQHLGRVDRRHLHPVRAPGLRLRRRRRGHDEQGNVLAEARPDMDMAIDKCKSIASKLGLDADKIFPYQKTIKSGIRPASTIPRRSSATSSRASKGSDADLTGMLEVEKRDGIGLYDQLRQLRGIQWPAPTYEIAKAGRHAAALHGPGRLGRASPTARSATPTARPSSSCASRTTARTARSLKEVTDELAKYGAVKSGEGPWL